LTGLDVEHEHGCPNRNESYRRYPAYFNAEDIVALSKAEARFKKLTGAGFTAALRDADGKTTVTRTFDPTAEETLFFPRLIGG
jgi:hypothetical protein